MHGIYDLKDKLCKELEEYGQKEEWDAGDLEIVDKVSHSLKNIEKIIDNYEGAYSGAYGGYEYSGGRNYARRNRYSRAGRYNRNGTRYSMADLDMIEELRDLMNDAPDEKIRKDFQKLIDKLENM